MKNKMLTKKEIDHLISLPEDLVCKDGRLFSIVNWNVSVGTDDDVRATIDVIIHRDK